MKTIAQNDYYAILVNTAKNRLYLTLTGFWKSRSVVPNYIEDMKKATQELSKGYTVLADVTQMKPPPKDVVNVHMEAQTVAIAAGLSTTAEIVSQDVITQMSINRFSKESGMSKGTFDNTEEAEVWLDEHTIRET